MSDCKMIRADDAKGLAAALLALWSPANLTQMQYPKSVPLVAALEEISGNSVKIGSCDWWRYKPHSPRQFNLTLKGTI